jgi:NDP-sugar pyrophosphorylase family protein
MIAGAILAGGLGTRLRSVMSSKPKVLAPVGGRPFITFLLDQMAHAGLRQVVLCTGYMGDEVRRALGDEYRGMNLVYSREDQPLGTGGALRMALDCTAADQWLVLNGDSYAAADFGAFIAWHRQHGFAGSLLLCWVEDCSRFGTVEMDAQGRISGFFEKRGVTAAGWINGGVYLLSRELVGSLPPKAHSIERDAFPAWVDRGLGGYCVRAPFIDIGTPESLAQASGFILRELERIACRSVS